MLSVGASNSCIKDPCACQMWDIELHAVTNIMAVTLILKQRLVKLLPLHNDSSYKHLSVSISVSAASQPNTTRLGNYVAAVVLFSHCLHL